jgi:hypothetical protein
VDFRDASLTLSGVLAVAEVPEALFGLATTLFWLGKIRGHDH